MYPKWLPKKKDQTQALIRESKLAWSVNTNKANSLIIFIIKVNAVIILLCNCSQMLLLWTGGSQDREWYCSVCVVRPRLIVITPQPHDGRRVLLISTDHIPLADWAINESVVIPQSAAQRPLLSHSPSSDPLIKFKGSPGVAKSPFPSAFISMHIRVLLWSIIWIATSDALCGY